MPRAVTTMLTALICITLTPLIAGAAPEKGTAAAGDKMIERGKQLVIEGNCDYCHTPLTETKEGPAPDSKRRLSGHPQDSEMPRLPDTGVGSPPAS